MDRWYWSRHIGHLDPERDYHEIYQIFATIEFPWDTTQALSFALYRTYAVPAIGGLLFKSGEFTQRAQKRYDDTGLLLDAVLEHGVASAAGRAAVRRINQMHGSYDIGNDDMRYVLATLVVVPIRWLQDFGWRRVTEKELAASANYYRELGRHLGIKGLPATHQEFATFMDDYEREHFAFDRGARAVADATLDLMATFPPNRWAPKALVRRFSTALMDDALLDAFGYRHPSRLERAVGRGVIRWRGRAVRYLPARTKPLRARDLSSVRSYPAGYDVARLGTFPRGCPVPPPTAPVTGASEEHRH